VGAANTPNSRPPLDTLVLARIALETAFRNEIDVLELLPDPPAPSVPRKAPTAALHVVVA
jgi:hypothetical protein